MTRRRSSEDGTPYTFDPRVAITHLRASDPAFAWVIDAVGPFDLRLQSAQSTFASLMEAIVYQQLNAKAAAAIFARVSALFPRARNGPKPEHILRATDEQLRTAGLSRAKLLALRDLAEKTASGVVPPVEQIQRMDDETIVERLTQVRGVGRWTAEMFLIFRLGRPDVLPVEDYGIRKGFAIAFKKRDLPTRTLVEKRGERWRPYRTVASWYLWRAVELQGRRATEA